MHLKNTIALAALSAGLVAAAPASAQSGTHGAGASASGGNVPSRVANRLKRAEKALDRASAYADDGNTTSAEAALGAVRNNLAAAEKRTNKKIAAGAGNGPDAAGAVASVEDDVIGQTTDLFDGADGTLVAAIDQTLNAGVDGRDSMVAAIGALSTADQQNYVDVLESIDSDVTDELSSIDDALADDKLTPDAQADLTADRAKLVATQTAVQALLAGLDTSGTSAADTADASGTGACDGHRGDRAARA
jgi:hypothetical protein